MTLPAIEPITKVDVEYNKLAARYKSLRESHKQLILRHLSLERKLVAAERIKYEEPLEETERQLNQALSKNRIYELALLEEGKGKKRVPEACEVGLASPKLARLEPHPSRVLYSKERIKSMNRKDLAAVMDSMPTFFPDQGPDRVSRAVGGRTGWASLRDMQNVVINILHSG